MKILACVICRKKFLVYGYREKTAKYCSIKCKGKFQSALPQEKQPAWKGGESINFHGYIRLRYKKGYIYKHRFLMEQYLGRKLKSNEVVHHIDGDRSNNKRSNLMIFKKRLHDKFETTRRHRTGFRKKGKGLDIEAIQRGLK